MKKTDRVPFDLAGTSLTGMEHSESVELLKQALGITGKYDGWYNKFDERILKRLDIAFTGMYWDICNPPLKDASIDDLDKYPWPKAENINPMQIDEYKAQAKKLFTETVYVVCAEHPVFGIPELGCWMCGFDDFLLKNIIEKNHPHIKGDFS
jgi:hypothetical protein